MTVQGIEPPWAPGYRQARDDITRTKRVIRKAITLAQKHGRHELAIELQDLLSDVRTAGDETLRTRKRLEDETLRTRRVLEDEYDRRFRRWQDEVEDAQQQRRASDAAVAAMAETQQWAWEWGRLVQTGYIIEGAERPTRLDRWLSPQEEPEWP